MWIDCVYSVIYMCPNDRLLTVSEQIGVYVDRRIFPVTELSTYA